MAASGAPVSCRDAARDTRVVCHDAGQSAVVGSGVADADLTLVPGGRVVAAPPCFGAKP
jgi:hypothetical protein